MWLLSKVDDLEAPRKDIGVSVHYKAEEIGDLEIGSKVLAPKGTLLWKTEAIQNRHTSYFFPFLFHLGFKPIDWCLSQLGRSSPLSLLSSISVIQRDT